MPRFLYKGKDRTGQIRTGTVEAPTYAEARKQLQTQGIEISMLNQAAEPREPRAEPVSSALPVPVEERGSGLKRLAAALALVLVVAAVAAWAVPRLSSRTAPAEGALQPGEVTRVVSLRGQVELLGTPPGASNGELLKDVRLTVIFPDVPTEITLYYPELNMTGSGSFDCKVHFLSVPEPKEANVSIRLAEFESSRQTNLPIKKNGELFELAVPRATMKARAGFVPRPADTDPTGPEEDDSGED